MLTRRFSGFTLVEMLVTLTLLAILALAVVPLAQMSVQRQQEAELRRSLVEIRAAIDSWQLAVRDGRIAAGITDSGCPPSLQSLVDGQIDVLSPSHSRIRFLRRLPRDPFAPDDLAAAMTWGLRSYASDANDPRPGQDVYDVYSLHEGVGLNGRPYHDW